MGTVRTAAVALIALGSMAQGESLTVVSDGAVKTSPMGATPSPVSLPAFWTLPEFDDSTWLPARSYGRSAVEGAEWIAPPRDLFAMTGWLPLWRPEVHRYRKEFRVPASAYAVTGRTEAAAPAQILVNGAGVPGKMSALPCNNVLTAEFAGPAETVAFALRLDYELPRIAWERNRFELTDREGRELPGNIPVFLSIYGPRSGNLRGPLVGRWGMQGTGAIPVRFLRANAAYTAVIRDVCTAVVLGSRSFVYRAEHLVTSASRD